MKNLRHKCSYYCTNSIHCLEVAIDPSRATETIEEYFARNEMEVVSIKDATEVTEDFKLTALGEYYPEYKDNYKYKLVFVKVEFEE